MCIRDRTIAFLSNKGKKIHTLSGKIFYYSLGISILISLMVAIMPAHYNPDVYKRQVVEPMDLWENWQMSCWKTGVK